jgi:hypothetical protein
MRQFLRCRSVSILRVLCPTRKGPVIHDWLVFRGAGLFCGCHLNIGCTLGRQLAFSRMTHTSFIFRLLLVATLCPVPGPRLSIISRVYLFSGLDRKKPCRIFERCPKQKKVVSCCETKRGNSGYSARTGKWFELVSRPTPDRVLLGHRLFGGNVIWPRLWPVISSTTILPTILHHSESRTRFMCIGLIP